MKQMEMAEGKAPPVRHISKFLPCLGLVIHGPRLRGSLTVSGPVLLPFLGVVQQGHVILPILATIVQAQLRPALTPFTHHLSLFSSYKHVKVAQIQGLENPPINIF